MEISIIIVNWNTKDLLRDCLNSVIEQTAKADYEIIVVDNNSTDGSIDMVKSEFKEAVLIENSKNLGFARANNRGIKVSKGRYVCLVNSDIILLDNCLDKLVSFMESNPRAGMAGPRILNGDMTLQYSCRHFPSIWNNLCQSIGLNHIFPKSPFFSDWIMNYWNHDSTRDVDALSGCLWIIRREALDDIGLLDEEFFIYGEDLDFCKRMRNANWDVSFYPEAQAIHLGGASSAAAPIKFYLEMQKADLQYWRKRHGISGKISYAAIILLRETIRTIARGMQYVLRPSKRETSGFKLRRSIASIRLILHI